jgi:hypothetical protein
MSRTPPKVRPQKAQKKENDAPSVAGCGSGNTSVLFMSGSAVSSTANGGQYFCRLDCRQRRAALDKQPAIAGRNPARCSERAALDHSTCIRRTA